jgi:hypothetical protein
VDIVSIDLLTENKILSDFIFLALLFAVGVHFTFFGLPLFSDIPNLTKERERDKEKEIKKDVEKKNNKHKNRQFLPYNKSYYNTFGVNSH